MSRSSQSDAEQGVDPKSKGVVLGDDWIAPDTADVDLRFKRARRKPIVINRSPLAQKIITLNLITVILMAVGILYLNPFRDSLVKQREVAMVTEASLIANMIATSMNPDALEVDEDIWADTAPIDPILKLSLTESIYVYDAGGRFVVSSEEVNRVAPVFVSGVDSGSEQAIISDFLMNVWDFFNVGEFGAQVSSQSDELVQLEALVPKVLGEASMIETNFDQAGSALFLVAAPIFSTTADGQKVALGVVGLLSDAGEIDALVRIEREQILEVFFIAIFVSVSLSVVLASMIANPLADLAAAAEVGRDKNSRMVAPGRIRIPDLTGRPDEIGRLSFALRGMVSALYDRIEANEQFAADVAHEIKNPLASLRSAVGSLRFVKKEEHQAKLLDVIEHDVRRLDRLVSDIANASRLDSELVKEEEEEFNLINMLSNLTQYLSQQAQEKGVEFMSDLLDRPIMVSGLEPRLAQVFVNLITNAISFCEDGDAIRVWVRKREERVLIVVEDTGPGIPDEALTKVFTRFYSERPENQFGNNSGLGLAISKQIVEAHGGVIWAENIRPTDADATSEPLGARFVVGLPVD